MVSVKEIEDIEQEIALSIEDAVKFAKESPYPSPEEVFEDLFV